MKRARGVDEVATTAGATLKHSTLGGGGGLGIGGLGGGGGGSINLEYHSASGIGVGVNSGQTVRPITSKDMPGSIQFGTTQTQQQYSGAIVVPQTAPSPVKVTYNHQLLLLSLS